MSKPRKAVAAACKETSGLVGFLLLQLTPVLPMNSCVVDSGFNPRGDDVSASSQWTLRTVNGLEPASLEEGCERARISQVKVVFFDFGGEFQDDRFSFPCAYDAGPEVTCASGSCAPSAAFDTSPQAVLEFGIYETEWQAIDTEGVIVARGPRLELETRPPDAHVDLTPVEFEVFQPFYSDASLEASWTIDGSGEALAEACAAAGIAEVALELREQGFPDEDGLEVAREACDAGVIAPSEPTLAMGRYLASYVGYDEDGTRAQETGAQPFETLDLGTSVVPGADFQSD